MDPIHFGFTYFFPLFIRFGAYMKTAKIFLATALVLAAGASQAATTANFDVKINIQATCDITAGAASDVDFGTVASTARNVDQQSALNVTCTPGTDYKVALNDGKNSASGARRMVHATAANTFVPYNLYLDAARQNAWGSTPATSFSGTGTGAAVSIPVYGRVPSANYPAGAYKDTVTATVSF